MCHSQGGPGGQGQGAMERPASPGGARPMLLDEKYDREMFEDIEV